MTKRRANGPPAVDDEATATTSGEFGYQRPSMSPSPSTGGGDEIDNNRDTSSTSPVPIPAKRARFSIHDLLCSSNGDDADCSRRPPSTSLDDDDDDDESRNNSSATIVTTSRVCGKSLLGGGDDDGDDATLVADEMPSPPEPTWAPAGDAPTLSHVSCHLEGCELWSKFHKLGTEMIITKSGR